MIVDAPQAELFDKFERNAIPYMGHLHLTERCNLTCVHCYRIGMPWGNELTTDEWIRIHEEIREEGCIDLTYSGGEPLLHPGWREIMGAAHEMRFQYDIFQNGTVITEEDIDFLAGHGLRELNFSIHGIGEVHDRFVKQDGAYDKAIAMFRYAARSGLKTVIKMSVMRQTYESIDELAGICADEGGVFAPSYYMIPRFVPGNDEFLDDRLTAAEIQEFERKYTERTGRPEFSTCIDENHPTMCNMGWSRFAVGPQGDLYPCVQVPEAVDNIRHKSFREAWRYSERLNEVRSYKGDVIEECSSCGVKSRCKYRCMGHNKQATGHYEKPAKEFCRITEAWVAMDEIVVEKAVG